MTSPSLMRLSADVESRGGATVYRFTPTSVRQALDAGWTADELLDALRGASRTGLPQPLEYLVRDVARRHGQTRVGGATAYIRSDDESVLESLLVERSLGALRLRRIAPTVLVSSADPETLLELLREAGYSPVQERPDGSVVVSVAAAAGPTRAERRHRPGRRRWTRGMRRAWSAACARPRSRRGTPTVKTPGPPSSRPNRR